MEVSIATVSENTAQNLTTAEPEELDLRSHDIAEDKKAELLGLFPEIRTEGGKIDFDKLKLVLGETVDVGRERYGMNWPGKADCFKTIQQPSLGTLLPRREESVNFDTTENLIVEGDNLEVLKLLQKSYLGKVKMIYIDPPYNTGNDFIYPDNYSESLQTYLEYTGQVDDEGRKYSTNAETDGRFHSKWLNMMYPRLYLARNLLRDDGVIFITIDNQEEDNLKKLCHEVFGEENYVATVVWQKKVSPANDAQWFSSDHDYVLVYARNKAEWRPFRLDRNETQLAYYKNPDNDPRGPWNSATYTCNKSKDERPNLYYPITNPLTNEEIWPKETAVWRYSKEVTDRYMREGRLYWGAEGIAKYPRVKLFLSEMDKVVPRSIWTYDDVGHTQEATTEVKTYFGDIVFDSPKPTRLVKRMIELSCGKSDLVLDFFAGSGTTGEAVIEANEEDGGSRQFILVQLPEPTGRNDFPTIADITKERVRRVLARITKASESSLPLGNPSQAVLGFKVYTLGESNLKLWKGSSDETGLAQQLELHVGHIREERTSEDLLYEILLKSGFLLTTPIQKVVIAEKDVFSISEGAMLICLDRNLTHEAIKEIADLHPQRVVCLDEGFAGNDQLKTNAVQTMKARGVTSFRTV